MMSRRLASSLVTGLLALACTRGEHASTAPDSTARTLTLVPSESTPALRDVPGAALAGAGAQASLAAGTEFTASVMNTISTRYARAGDAVVVRSAADVRAPDGTIVIPVGATVAGRVVRAVPAPNPRARGHLDLEFTRVTVGGRSYRVHALVVALDTVRQGRGFTKTEGEKVGAGAALGAIAGKLIGRSTAGVLVGGAVGAGAGGAVAARTRTVDVALLKGATVRLRLTEALSVGPQ